MGASVTFWEATAPVKLPTRHCPEPRSGAPLELKFNEAGIPLLAPPELTPELHSLPAILYTLNPSPMPRCSKAPRGLSVLPRVTCIFTGIAVSPSICPRQRPTRYAIRAGRNLPDKEFRFLLTCNSQLQANGFSLITVPACRHAAGTISSSLIRDVRRMVSEDSDHFDQSFLLIFCTGRIVTASLRYRQIRQVFQHMAECITAPLPAREAACFLP